MNKLYIPFLSAVSTSVAFKQNGCVTLQNDDNKVMVCTDKDMLKKGWNRCCYDFEIDYYYCCSPGEHRSTSYTTRISGGLIAMVVILIVVLLFCCLCRTCPLRKCIPWKRRRSDNTDNTTEATESPAEERK